MNFISVYELYLFCTFRVRQIVRDCFKCLLDLYKENALLYVKIYH